MELIISSEQHLATTQWVKNGVRTKTLPLISVVFLGLCLFALLFSVVVEINTTLNQEFKSATQGKLNLEAVDLTQSKPIPLSGEWEFYWQQFVLSENFANDIDAPHDMVNVPISWESQVYLGEPISAKGFATYRLRIQTAPGYEELALSVPVIGTAYRLYVNQQLVDQAGKVASEKQHSSPEYSPKIITFKAQSGKIDIVLQVSNYHLAWGGQWFPMKLASAETLMQTQLQKLVRSVTIASIFFTMAVLSLFHFALRSTDFLPFLLALSCICLGLREIETSHILYITNSVSLGFNSVIRLNFLTFYLAIPLITYYFRLSYPNEFKRWPVLFICAVGGLFSLSTVVTPPVIFSEFMLYFQYFSLCILIYALYLIFLAAYRRRTGARLMALGSMLLFVLSINDILFSMRIINTGSMAGPGLLSFALCQNYLTYVRFINDSRDMHAFSAQANQDPLTLLLNRRGLMEAFKHVDSEQRQDSDHYSVMLIDFDHFKLLNDTLGHDAGDLVLARGSAIMQQVIRQQDLAARWGGEEFVIILGKTNESGAKVLAEKLRLKISRELSEQLKHSVTVSIGVAQNFEGETLAACLKRADQALYSAKAKGRNRVELASNISNTEVN